MMFSVKKRAEFDGSFKLVVFIVLGLVFNAHAAAFPETVSYGVSQMQLQVGKVYTLYEYSAGAAVQTYFWLTGTYNNNQWGSNDSAGDMIFSIYIDGATSPTYQFTPYQLIGVGFSDNTAPWGNEIFGRNSKEGGIYSHMKIPFQTSIRYDVTLPPKANVSSILFWQVRLTKNIGVQVGGVTLPSTAKLVQYRFVDHLMERLDFITFVNTKNSGAVYMHFFQGSSKSANFMEGCYRAYYGTSTVQSLISTGFEDYYQSAYYFSAGTYRLAGAGNTHQTFFGAGANISAYKVHDTDSLFFPSGGFQLVWRNGDTQSAGGFKCADPKGAVVGNPTNTTITSFTWVYEW